MTPSVFKYPLVRTTWSPMLYKNLFLAVFCLLSNFALSMHHDLDKKKLHVQQGTMEVWVERMICEGKGCQLIKKNVDEDTSFAVNIFFDDNQNCPVESILLTPSSGHLFIVRKNTIILVRLSTKSYKNMVAKKAKKGSADPLNVAWGIVKEQKVYAYPSPILNISFEKNMDLCVREENGTISLLDFMRLWGPARLLIG